MDCLDRHKKDCLSFNPDSINLPSMGCDIGADPYQRKLKLLLREGDAWDIPDGGVFDRLLLALAEEFSRFHFHICKLAADAPFSVGPLHGWSNDDYRKLLSEQWGITAEVTDYQCDILHVDNFDADSSLWPDEYAFFVIITVPKLADIPQHVRDCLNNYKQSHTYILWREWPFWEQEYEYDVLHVDNAQVNSDVWETDWHAIAITSHPSLKYYEMFKYLEHPMDVRHLHFIEGTVDLCQKVNYLDYNCGLSALHVDNAQVHSLSRDSDWYRPYDITALSTDNAMVGSDVYEDNWHRLVLMAPEFYDMDLIVAKYPDYLGIRHWQTVRPPKIEKNLDIHALHVDNARVNSDVYENDWHEITITAHPSYDLEKIIKANPDKFGIRNSLFWITRASTVDNSHASSVLYGISLSVNSSTTVNIIYNDNWIASEGETSIINTVKQHTRTLDTKINHYLTEMPHAPY